MKELSVGEAAEFLGKTERTIRLYITEKTIKARKVGKRWYVDRKSLEDFRKSSGNFRKSSGNFRKYDDSFPEKGPETSANAGPNRLACFRLARQAFALPLWQKDRAELSQVREGVFRALGAGYYSYGSLKREYYTEARAHIGSALGLIYSDHELLAEGQEEVLFLEEKLMPALNALIKSMEKRERAKT